MPSKSIDNAPLDHPNPMRRDGLVGRVGPFAVAVALAIAVAAVQATNINETLFIASAALLVLTFSSSLLPWHRLPVALQSGPPIASFIFVALMRYAAEDSFFGYGILLLLPIVWIGLYGLRLDLKIALVVGTLSLVVPIAIVGPPSYPTFEGLLQTGLWVVTAVLVGTTIQSLIQGARRNARESARQTRKIGETQAQFVQAFNEAAIGMTTTGLDGTMTGFNDAYLEIIGYTADELQGMDFEKLTVPEDREDDRESFAAFLAGDMSTLQGERRLVHKDGHLVSCIVSITAIRNAESRPSYFFTTIQDVSELRHAEREAQRLADIVRASDDAILSCLTNGTVTSWNPGAVGLFGYNAEEIIGKTIPILVPDDRAGEETMVVKRVLGGEIVQGHETQALTKSGELVDVALTVSPMRDASGKVTSISLIASDLTERKRAQEESDRLKSEFFSLVSHEFRTPLTSIVGYVEMMMEPGLELPDDKRSEFLHTVKRNSERLLRLVGDLLLVSEMRNDVFTIEPRKIDMKELAQNAVAAATPNAAEAGLELIAEIESTQVWGDPDRLAQLIDNLVANAVKYTPEGEVIAVGLHEDHGEAVLDVTNSGVEIPATELERLFEPFFRASNAITGVKQGAGLGLVITKRIVEAHEGRIEVTSNAEIGVRFRVTLPMIAHARFIPPAALDRTAA